MWVSKPIYESLPYFYLLAGAICLGASMYVNHWHWPTICFVSGLLILPLARTAVSSAMIAPFKQYDQPCHQA